MRGKSKGRRRARAAATTTALTKSRRGGRRAKVDTKPINMQEPGSEMKGAARRTVMMKSGGPAVTRSGSRTPAETQTPAWVWRRGGQTGKQRARKVRMALLETKLSWRDAAGRKTTSFASVPQHIIRGLVCKPVWVGLSNRSCETVDGGLRGRARPPLQRPGAAQQCRGDVGRPSWTGALLAARAIISSLTFIFPGCVRKAETNAVGFFLKLL